MKIANVSIEDGSRVAIETKQAGWRLLPDNGVFTHIRSAQALIEQMDGVSREKLAEISTNPLEDCPKFLCPITRPDKIICVGSNYAGHAKEMGGETPEIPVIFNKLASSLIGQDDSIVLPAISNKVDYEAELVVVIGKSGKHITPGQALDHVFGYTIGNDVTARDWQKGRPGGQWLLGKSFDTFGPIGPYIVTADEIADPHNLNIELRLNDQVMQSANTSQFIFDIEYLISHISKFFTLCTGDLLFTGTPAGVGAGRNPEVYLGDGDHLEVSIDRIGSLANPVVAERR